VQGEITCWDPRSGSITWWGWTPDAAPAEAYIKAFNEVYPNIKVTYKKQTIDGYDAAIRPALASSVGPDVFDVAPGAANGSVDIYGVNAVDLAPTVQKFLGADWKSKLAPIGVSSLTNDGKLAALSVGSNFAGSVWVDQDLFDKYGLKPPTNYDEWKQVCAAFKTHGIKCFVQGAAQTAFNEDTLQAISNNVKPGVWAQALDKKVPWTDPTIVKALIIWKGLFDDGIMQEGALGTQQWRPSTSSAPNTAAAPEPRSGWGSSPRSTPVTSARTPCAARSSRTSSTSAAATAPAGRAGCTRTSDGRASPWSAPTLRT
jgi:raffinose/stachyose/melibiose transport system substrate-binding protein